jgi:hypothetical protein
MGGAVADPGVIRWSITPTRLWGGANKGGTTVLSIKSTTLFRERALAISISSSLRGLMSNMSPSGDSVTECRCSGDISPRSPGVQTLGTNATKPRPYSQTNVISSSYVFSMTFVNVRLLRWTTTTLCFITLSLHYIFSWLWCAGTANIIQSCLEHNVPRLIYTSSVDVVVGFDDIINGDESLPAPKRFLFPGYPETKHRAENLVSEANGRALAAGNYWR